MPRHVRALRRGARTYRGGLRTGTFLRTLPPLGRAPRQRAPLRGRRDRLRGLGGGSVRGSPCDGPARLRSGLPGSVAEEAVHREGRCAASGEAPDRSVPLRYAEEGQRSRSGCSGPRMPGSEGMDPRRPVSLRPPPSARSAYGAPRCEGSGCGFASGVPLPRSLRRRTHPRFAGNGTLRGGRHA